MVDRLKSWWPFQKADTAGITATHRLNVSLASDGVIYSSEPALADWPEHWARFGSDAALVSFLAQQEELGFVDLVDQSIRLGWESLYRLLKEEPGDATELLALLHLPPLTDYRPSLASHGSLEDREFRVTLGEWVSPTLGRLGTPPEITGAVIRFAGQQGLMAEAVWHLTREVREFYAIPPNGRSASGNRQAWARIRRYALDAGAPMADFLQRTIVLTPEKLDLQMRKSEIAGARTVQVEPGFRGAPAKWLETFDKFSSVPERYDIPDGEGIIQVLIAPQVRSVLQEIRRWPGRMVSGQRAEAFIRNPFACLGEDAVAVIDETQFESAREAAGIEFERFSISAERDSNGTVSGVSLLIESASSYEIRSNRYDFPDLEHLDRFINRFTSRLRQGHPCFVWEGYELEILGNAEDQLAELN